MELYLSAGSNKKKRSFFPEEHWRKCKVHRSYCYERYIRASQLAAVIVHFFWLKTEVHYEDPADPLAHSLRYSAHPGCSWWGFAFALFQKSDLFYSSALKPRFNQCTLNIRVKPAFKFSSPRCLIHLFFSFLPVPPTEAQLQEVKLAAAPGNQHHLKFVSRQYLAKCFVLKKNLRVFIFKFKPLL